MTDLSITLRRFKRSNDPKLELPNKNISFVPNEIYDFQQLEVLDLSNNNINSLDGKIGQLKKLKILDLSLNKLITLPQELLQLPNLQVLKLEGNPLSIKFEVLQKSENQTAPRLQDALKFVFGLTDTLEESKVQEQQHQNQGNLMKDLVDKDSQIDQQKIRIQELESQVRRLNIQNAQQNQGGKGLQVSSRVQVVREYDLNELQIGQQISQGGFSTVHIGQLQGCPVAIKKIFNPNINEELLDELNNEITMLAQLRHPQIVLLMGIINQPPNLCIITELAQNGNLYSYLHQNKRNTQISVQKKVSIAFNIANIFAYLHTNKIVHRDLKSLNILLDENNKVKLCDFGLARQFDTVNQGTSKFSGTPVYMALELYQKKAYNHKVDVFAFGTLLWEIFAREVPFDQQDPNEIMERVQRDEQLPQTGDVTREVADLVRRCRSQNPDERPEFTEISQILSVWNKRY